jgi:hypothetical protein
MEMLYRLLLLLLLLLQFYFSTLLCLCSPSFSLHISKYTDWPSLCSWQSNYQQSIIRLINHCSVWLLICHVAVEAYIVHFALQLGLMNFSSNEL